MQIIIAKKIVWFAHAGTASNVFQIFSVFCASLLVRQSECDVYYNGANREFSGSSLTVLPHIPSEAVTVNIHRSSFSKIDANAFAHLHKCKTIKMWDNTIGTIKNEAFNELPSLSILYTWRSQITTIQKGAFGGLNNLRELKLWANNITTIQSYAFRGFGNLVEMAIWNNDVTRMKSRAVTWTNASTTVNEWNNRVTYREEDSFYGPIKPDVPSIIGMSKIFFLFCPLRVCFLSGDVIIVQWWIQNFIKC